MLCFETLLEVVCYPMMVNHVTLASEKCKHEPDLCMPNELVNML